MAPSFAEFFLPFFRHLWISLLDVCLEPLRRDCRDSGNASKGNVFDEHPVNQLAGGLINYFFSGLFDELSAAVLTLIPLFAVVNAAILDGLRGCTNWTSRHRVNSTYTLPILSLHDVTFWGGILDTLPR